MPPKIVKRTKPQILALFRFTECISIILKIHKVQLLQIESYFVRTPMNNLSKIQGFSLFETTKFFKIKRCDLNCFEAHNNRVEPCK